ncbi:uncharacterized protein N7459_002047 [Penicillium hispanicum]|uniref:uncharacterized protein n=1 Tax=Penicillium hispanicum TaxID=1080232 RepID=UPI0025403348|nr:uncharacterized protein N7459_002047 [Penicillium hispanicum]KAJ5591678.1 hypothetical protein N7459_002047 [Penicillium hispanicum]
MTAAQKKKAKKDKKKKAKQQSVSSVTEDEKPSESQPSESRPTETLEPQPTELKSADTQPTDNTESIPDIEATSTEAVTEPSAQDSSLDVTIQESKKDESTKPGQPEEEVSAPELVADAVTNTSVEPTDAERSQADSEVPPDQPAVEETPAEPEVPMTAAQKKKAKKAKKKQQSMSSVPDDTQAAEIVSALETSTPESKKDAEAIVEAEAPPVDEVTAPGQDTEFSDTRKEVQFAPEAETHPVEDTSVSAAEAPAVEPVGHVPSVSEDVTAPNDAPPEEQKEVPPETELPKEDDPSPLSTVEASVAAEAEAPREEPEPEHDAGEPEVPMTAAEKKKAKKEKKKQQKRQSVQVDEQPTAGAEASSTQNDAEEAAEVTTSNENATPAETSSPVDEEVKTADEALPGTAPTEAEIASLPEAKPGSEESQATATATVNAEKETSVEPSVEAATISPTQPLSETTLDRVENEKAVSDLPVDESTGSSEVPLAADPTESTTAVPSSENQSTEKTGESEPVTTLSKKDKKKKKKRQSLALEDEQQPAPAKEEDSPEPTRNENVEPSTENSEIPGVTTEAPNSEEPVLEEIKDDSIPEQPGVEVSEGDSQSTSKKKAKKDKKKRKSVAWEDETQTEDASTIEAAVTQEGTEEPARDHQTIEATQDKDVSETTEAVQPDQQVAPLESQGEAVQPEVPVDQELKEPEPQYPAPTQPDEQPEPAVEPAVEPTPQSDEKLAPLTEPSTPSVEASESAAEVGLSAKERRKLKKKEKKKSKSVELTADEPSTPVEASQDPEISTDIPTEASKALESELPTQDTQLTEDADASNVEETVSPEVVNSETVEQRSTEAKDDLEPNVEAEKSDNVNVEPETTVTEAGKAADLETTKPKESDDNPPATEVAVDPESTPPLDTEEKPEQVIEPEAEASMSAKERRKAKKKEKKRQSKNLDADDNATPSPASAEPSQDMTSSKNVPADSEFTALAQDSDKAITAEADSTDPPAPVTATSPTEHDGKEHQSHDTETLGAPQKDLASTDEFVSSQVERSQIESPSSDFPPQPLLERELDFGDATKGEVQREEDVVPVASELDVPPAAEKEIGGDEVEKEGNPEENDWQAVPGQEGVTAAETVDEVVNLEEKPSVSKAGAPVVAEEAPGQGASAESVEDAAVLTGQDKSTEEEMSQATSKKQKKKDKKKKQKQQQDEEKNEEVSPAEPQPPGGEAKEQSEAAAAIPEETTTQTETVVEPKPVTEQANAPIEEPSTEPTPHLVEEPVRQASEDVGFPAADKPTEAENLATESQQLREPGEVDSAPSSRKLSKKQKKKQRQALLAEESAPPESLEAPTSAHEPADATLSTNDQQDKQTVGETVETATQYPGAAEEITKDFDSTPSEAQQAGTGNEVETAEPSTEPSSRETKTEHPEPQSTPDEPPTSQPEQALKGAIDQPTLEAAKQSEPEQEPLESSEKGAVESAEQVVSDPSQDAVNKPIEASAQTPEPAEPAISPEEVAKPPIEPEALTRKVSKKEKRKAKKQGKLDPADLTAVPAVESPSENVEALESQQADVPPGGQTTEASGIEQLREEVTGPESITQETSLKVEPHSQSENLVSDPEISTKEVEAQHEEDAHEKEQNKVFVAWDPIDGTEPTGDEDQAISAEAGEQSTAQAPKQDLSLEQQEKTNQEEVKSQGEALDKEGRLEVPDNLLEDRPQEPESEIIAPVSKKLSKKEKRKAKKKGALEETGNVEEDQEAIPEPAPVESQEAHTAALTPEFQIDPLVESALPAESQHPVEPEHTKELEPEAAVQVEAPMEVQPAPEKESPVEHEPIVPEPATEDPEPILSRKASKKKAKKAKKASQTVDIEAPTNKDTDEELIGPLEQEELSKDLDFPAPTTQDTKQDDEWPAIEWENGKFVKAEPPQEPVPEPEPLTSVPAAETIPEYDESAIPAALMEVKKEPEAIEEEVSATSLSKKDKKKAKKSKRKSEQAALAEPEESPEEPSHKKVELVAEPQSESSLAHKAPVEIETESPVRTSSPGGSKIANLFPGLERGGFRRPALDKQSPSLKDSAEEETAAALEANRNIAIPVSEAPTPLATTETREIADLNTDLPVEQTKESTPAVAEHHALAEAIAPKEESSKKPELPDNAERFLQESSPEPMHSASKERSSMLFGSSPSTRTEEPSTPRHLLPSQMEADDASCGLRRTPSVIHGRHQHTPRTWSLEESSIQAVRAPSPPRSLFGGPFGEHDAMSRPRTPLDTIAEQEPGDGSKATTHRLEVKPEHVLPRPHTPVRKFTDNALAREAWPTPGNDKPQRSHDDLSKFSGETASPILKTPDQGMPVLKPSSSQGKLRRTNRSTSGDLRAVSRALDSQPPPSLDLDQLPSSSSYDPVTDKGKRPLRNMSDVYGWGETPSSPRSPSRPPSVRRRRSMQHLQDIESRLDQLISENRLLIAARDEAEDKLRNASVARRKSDRALNNSGADLRDKEAEVEQLKNSVEWLQREMARLSQENEGLTASNAALAAAHADEVHHVRESSTRELDVLRSQHADLSTQMEDRVRQEIESALAQKDTELRRLREELEEARDKVKELQQQISASVNDNALAFHDEDYFEAASQKLCGHVQQWVLRFSKHSDHRRCRSLGELHDEKVADRFDNALLDGSDADSYLSDRVNRRNVFMSVVMTMIWEFIFTRYLFGMDREQRQKLKSLEKQLGEVGPRRAVHRWRATTLTLLSRRPAFASQRQSDTEAVALEIFGTLSRVLPPPSHVEAQLLESLRKVLRVAVNLSLEMRTQLAEFIMLPPLQPEYDTNGDLARQVYFNASLMNERSGETSSNDELEAQQAVVRIVLFPLVVKKGNDLGEGDDEVVVCPAQVLVARPGKEKRVSRMMSGDRMSLDASKSVHSVAPSVAPSSMMDMSNVV